MNDLEKIVVYLFGLGDGGLDIGAKEFNFPLFLHESISCVMVESAAQDHNSPADIDPFAAWGKWHRAANIAMRSLHKTALVLTDAYEYPEGLAWGDNLHAALMHATRTHSGI